CERSANQLMVSLLLDCLHFLYHTLIKTINIVMMDSGTVVSKLIEQFYVFDVIDLEEKMAV
ncbi:hypothetical protein, partial [[Clostridium] scindens]|uniref:hypothetical protein n=1 Tax=Clostridium scindens (strain JCM 10418 / VPI 12708) TaxID=29347 RepID=UPI0022E220A2